MPEGLEAELYRRSASACIGRAVASVEVDDRQEMAGAIRSALPGAVITAVRRHGKQVYLDTAVGGEPAPTLGLHFGMTGRLVVDGTASIEHLEYASGRDDPAWDRLILRFDDGGLLRINDPRRWATFSLDPDESRLGPDLMSVGVDDLVAAFGRRRAAVKTVLLDQGVVAGLGNLCVDELLWQAALSPHASVRDLRLEHVDGLIGAMRKHLPAMLRRGGSHRGTIDPELRAALPPCPRDGAALRREALGGRTTIWCVVHQLDPGGM